MNESSAEVLCVMAFNYEGRLKGRAYWEELIREEHGSVISEKRSGPLIGSDETRCRKVLGHVGFSQWRQRELQSLP